jgi:hypothetical protein
MKRDIRQKQQKWKDRGIGKDLRKVEKLEEWRQI